MQDSGYQSRVLYPTGQLFAVILPNGLGLFLASICRLNLKLYRPSAEYLHVFCYFHADKKVP